ncbi:ABC transporter permease [Arcobacter arenosus]|uniref:ABC transporter permease n=1 Tax=Arcobacter arenosus TaxID=2576037 RepID=A0A5R8Y2N8_9BACT|nr:ABC transporter permease [Arcobacter arenosus]TLP39298.1 ABC transporter permease [Arcobacter arenosus]
MQTISFFNLSLTFIPLIFVWYFYKKWTFNSNEILISTFRMVIQLIAIGYLLVFIFETKSIYVDLAIMVFMITISAWITLRVTSNKSLKHYGQIFSSVAISGFINLGIIVILVLELKPPFEARYVIPIAGMVFSNAMNALSLAIERFEKEIQRGEEFEKAREIAFKACMIPQINSLLAVGLVSLPGMMTGQILSGVDPLIAVRYQIMIMTMILSNAGISSVIYFSLKKPK